MVHSFLCNHEDKADSIQILSACFEGMAYFLLMFVIEKTSISHIIPHKDINEKIPDIYVD